MGRPRDIGETKQIGRRKKKKASINQKGCTATRIPKSMLTSSPRRKRKAPTKPSPAARIKNKKKKKKHRTRQKKIISTTTKRNFSMVVGRLIRSGEKARGKSGGREGRSHMELGSRAQRMGWGARDDSWVGATQNTLMGQDRGAKSTGRH